MNAEKGNMCMINGLTGATREKLVWTFAIYREKGVKRREELCGSDSHLEYESWSVKSNRKKGLSQTRIE